MQAERRIRHQVRTGKIPEPASGIAVREERTTIKTQLQTQDTYVRRLLSAFLWCTAAAALVSAAMFVMLRRLLRLEWDLWLISLVIFFGTAWIIAPLYAIKSNEERREARENRKPWAVALCGSLMLAAGIAFGMDLLQHPGRWARWMVPAGYLLGGTYYLTDALRLKRAKGNKA